MRPPVSFDPERALAFLTSRIDYERTSTVPYSQRDFRLDRMRQLLERLGDPQRRLRIVHVAGTKGKGSTAAMVASMLQAAGLRTGLYSSPHLDRVEERLRIDGVECPPEELADLVRRIEPVVAEMDALPVADPRESNRPTYFEIVTALALLRFAERAADAAVLEVGLGGRLDSTNVCQPLVSVVTSISFDHTQQLGRTLAAIAGEKAGIIKPHTPVVSGVLLDEPRQVIAQFARRLHAPLWQLGVDFGFDYRPPRGLDDSATCGQLDYWCRPPLDPGRLDQVELKLIGRHQAANAAVALATIGQLRQLGWNVPDAAIRQGLASVRWPARIEVLSRHPTVVLDAAHNVASIEALVETLDESFAARRRILVLATTRDKDLHGMLAAALPKFDEVVFTRYWNNPRGVPPEELASLAATIGCKPRHICADPSSAWRKALERAERDDLICVTGSFFIAAEMRAAIRGAAAARGDDRPA